MGEEKTMDFITALIVQHIEEIGEGRVPDEILVGKLKKILYRYLFFPYSFPRLDRSRSIGKPLLLRIPKLGRIAL
jgi:hypothetical protein